jgi:hypothetical protein
VKPLNLEEENNLLKAKIDYLEEENKILKRKRLEKCEYLYDITSVDNLNFLTGKKGVVFFHIFSNDVYNPICIDFEQKTIGYEIDDELLSTIYSLFDDNSWM